MSGITVLLSLIILEVNLQRMLLLLILCRAREVDIVTTVPDRIVVNIMKIRVARAGQQAVETTAKEDMVEITSEVVVKIRHRLTGAGFCCLLTDRKKWCVVRVAQVAPVFRKKNMCGQRSRPVCTTTTRNASMTQATRVTKRSV
jgi:hypothetical protein